MSWISRTVLVIFAGCGAVQAQLAPAASAGQATQALQLPISGRSASSGSTSATQTPVPGVASSVNTLNPSLRVDGAYAGSVPADRVTESEVVLTIREAVRRGLEFNLGPVGLSNALRQARGQATVSRSALLPNISGNLRQNVQKVNLAALGVSIPFAPRVVGPFNYFDLRATLTQSLVDLTSLNNLRAARENAAAVEHLLADARDTVVFAVVGSCLQTIAAQSRADLAKAQLRTAETLLRQANEQNEQGVLARIDVNRSQVQVQMQEQRLITLQNDVAKQKLNLARMIGIAPAQSFMLSESMPATAPPAVTLDEALKRSAANRADLRAAEAQVRAAERVRTAASAERLPSLVFTADYGAIGVNPAQAAATYTVSGNLRIPIWQGGRTEGNLEQASATLQQRRAELADLRARIDQEVRTAFLDLESAASQIRVARSNLEVAQHSLELTRQRVEAGITDPAELVRAQELVATAEHDILTSSFSHNLARTSLARALGRTEENLASIVGLP